MPRLIRQLPSSASRALTVLAVGALLRLFSSAFPVDFGDTALAGLHVYG